MSGLYLKWTDKGRVPPVQGGASIPYRKWTERVASPVPCRRGWHACHWEDALRHIAEELWVCELGGEIVAGVDKVAAERLRLVRRVRLDDRALRLFAADAAERVLDVYERQYPGDSRVRDCIAVARRFAVGEASTAELSAARSAAGSAAWSAAGSAGSVSAAAAAWASAAWSSERSWQADRLLGHYLGLDPADFAHREAP